MCHLKCLVEICLTMCHSGVSSISEKKIRKSCYDCSHGQDHERCFEKNNFIICCVLEEEHSD